MPWVVIPVFLANCLLALSAGTAPRGVEASPDVQAGDWMCDCISDDPASKRVVEFSSDFTFTTQDGDIAGTWEPQGSDRLILRVGHGDRTYITDDKGKHFVATDGTAKLIFVGAARWWRLRWMEAVTTSLIEHTNPPTLPSSTRPQRQPFDPYDSSTEPPSASTTGRPGSWPHIDPGLVPYTPPSFDDHRHQVPHTRPLRPVEDPTRAPVQTTRAPSGKPIGIGIPSRGQTLAPELGLIPSQDEPTRTPGTNWWWQLHRWIQGHGHHDGPYSPPDVPGTPEPKPVPEPPTTHAPVVAPVWPSPEDGIDCHTGLVRWWTWPQEQQRYCCQESRVQCPSRRYDCEEDLDKWQSVWSSQKSAFCCQFEGVGCPSDDDEPDTYDCDIRSDNAYQSWDEIRKEWCCAEKNVGCQDTLEPMPVLTTTTSLQGYDFDVSGSDLRVGNVYPNPSHYVYPQYPSQNVYPPRGLTSGAPSPGYISQAEVVVSDAPEHLSQGPEPVLGPSSLKPTSAVSSSSLLAVTVCAFAATLVLVVVRSAAAASGRSSVASDEQLLSESSSGEEC